jgi:hypothetical protein
MAYSTGSTILDDDYNIFATGNAAGTGDHTVANINSIFGVGSVDKGYGQAGTLPAVAAGTTISATQWSTMLSRISTIASHQGTTITAITSPVAGNTVSAYAALSANITAIYNNKGNAAANGTDITTGGSGTGITSFYTSCTATTTVTFGTSTEARYFFNSGGMIRLTPARSGVANAKSIEWNTLAVACGTIAFTGGTATQTIAAVAYTGTTKIGGSGTAITHASTTGFHDLTAGAAAATIYTQYSVSAVNGYASNYISITVALGAAGTVLTFVTTFYDGATDTTTHPDGAASILDRVDGTTGCTVVVRPPSATYLTSTWGTQSMASSIAYV